MKQVIPWQRTPNRGAFELSQNGGLGPPPSRAMVSPSNAYVFEHLCRDLIRLHSGGAYGLIPTELNQTLSCALPDEDRLRGRAHCSDDSLIVASEGRPRHPHSVEWRSPNFPRRTVERKRRRLGAHRWLS